MIDIQAKLIDLRLAAEFRHYKQSDELVYDLILDRLMQKKDRHSTSFSWQSTWFIIIRG